MKRVRIKEAPAPAPRLYLRTDAGEYEVEDIDSRTLMAVVPESLGNHFGADIVFSSSETSYSEKVEVRASPGDNRHAYQTPDGRESRAWERLRTLGGVCEPSPAADRVWTSVLGTALFVVAGIAGLTLLGVRLHTVYFVTTAMGKVTADAVVVTARSAGTFIPSSLARGDEVEAGETLGVIEVSDGARGQPGDSIAHYSIVSPCRCVIVDTVAVADGYVANGQPAYVLAKDTAVARVEATLPPSAFDDVLPGASARLEILGWPETVTAEVERVAIRGSQMVASLRPTEPLPLTALDAPVRVTIGALL